MKLLFLEPPQAKIYQYQFPCVFSSYNAVVLFCASFYRHKTISALKTQGNEGNRYYILASSISFSKMTWALVYVLL